MDPTVPNTYRHRRETESRDPVVRDMGARDAAERRLVQLEPPRPRAAVVQTVVVIGL